MFAASLLLAVAVCVTGCAKWRSVEQHTPLQSLKIPTSRMSPDAVSLEVAVAQLDEEQNELIEKFWALLDQQKIPFEHRKVLDANGFRAAVVPAHVPGALRELLKPREIDPESLNSFQKQMYDKDLLKPVERLIVHDKVQNRDAESQELPVSSVHPEMNWLISTPRGKSAGAGKSVRGVFSIKTFPNGDGSVRVKLLPQIHHGEPRTQIGVFDKSFLFQSQQSIVDLADLATEIELLPGETLVVGATSDVDDLGKLFFGTPGSDQKHQRLVLIRLVQTQWDDLFGRRNRSQRLISAPHE